MEEPYLIKTFPAEGIHSLLAETLAGNITVSGSDTTDIKVEVYVHSLGWVWGTTSRQKIEERLRQYDLIIEKQEDKIVALHRRKPETWNWNSWMKFMGISYKIYVPQNISTTLQTSGGKISLENLIGKQRFSSEGGNLKMANIKGEIHGRTSGGNIAISGCSEKIDLQTYGGNIVADSSEGLINLRTSGGNLRFFNLGGEIEAHTSGGNIQADKINGTLKVSTSGGFIRIIDLSGNIDAQTSGGGIQAEVNDFDKLISLDTNGGNIHASIPLNRGMNLDLSGSRVRIPRTGQFEGFAQKRSIHGKLNGGGAMIRMRTSGGRVIIRDAQKETFYSIAQSFTESDFNLSPNFFVRNFKGFLLSFTLCFLMTFGLSAIIYFSLALIRSTPVNPSTYEDNKSVVINNAINAFITLLVLYWFISRKSHGTGNFRNYLKLILWSYVAEVVIHGSLIGILYKRTPRVNTGFSYESLLYISVPAIVASIYYYFWQRSKQISMKISEQEYRLLQLEKLKTKAELDALQARINPHFLHNALNSIASLVYEEPAKAEKMTLLLSKLFRYSTGSKNQQFNSIAEELEIVNNYLAIEQVRFGTRLTYTLEVENGLQKLEIPCFLLQPIVENAIKHGISQNIGQGVIKICIAKESDVLKLSVHDNGPAFPDTLISGYGLKSIQDKLRLLYDDKAEMIIENALYKQVIIKIKIQNSAKNDIN